MKKNHYIKNSHLRTLIVDHNNITRQAKLEGRKLPPTPNEIGIAFLLLSKRTAERYNFRKYPFVEEMIADGYEDCLRRMHNFDPSISPNAFGYFSLVIFRAFVRRIKYEKRYLKTKLELTERLNLLGLTADTADGDGTNYNIEVNQTDETLEYLR